MASNAERQRRYRKHRSGDHTVCDPARCFEAGTRVDTGATAVTRGRRLWNEMSKHGSFDPGDLVLLEEACRITDRLDRLHRQLDGGMPWLRLQLDETGEILEVVVDHALSEARQQATALKQLLAELRVSRGKSMPKPKGAGDGVSDLSARIAARRTQTTG